MKGPRPARLILSIFAALAITVFVSSRAALAQDGEDSAAGADASWKRTGPALDEDAESADKVLEIPQVACAEDGVPTVPCDVVGEDGNVDEDGNNDTQNVNAASPGTPPTLDGNTADASSPDQDWGTLEDYENQQVYGIPYGMSPYGMTVAVQTMNQNLWPAPYMPTSSPLTPAARPPLNPGPWRTMSFRGVAGRPMMMSHHSFGFHH